MHKSAILRMRWFVENYIPADRRVCVLDVGSCDVNGSYRVLFDRMDADYVGLDMEAGVNVDYVPENPYLWDKLKDGSFDFVISGNAFEHIEYPWLTIREIYRVLKKGGFACILTPNSLYEHRYPTDCYRYFPDGFRTLAKWGGFEIVDVTVSGVPAGEVFADEYISVHNDIMMVLAKEIDKERLSLLPRFECEKRYPHACEWARRYNFMLKWCNEKDKKGLLRSYIEREHIKKLYLYGYSGIGKVIYETLADINGVEINIIDQQAERISEIKAIKTGTRIDEGADSYLLCAVLDMNILDDLDQYYPYIRKKYADDIF